MIVEVKEGKLEGTTKKSILSGKEYCAFLGIPYGKPPIGDLRFRSPVPICKWSGILDAKEERSSCIQINLEDKQITGSEDCLFLNVYTPEPPSQIKVPKPVMVYIHGGAFQHGSGGAKSYGADYLITHDIIYVTLNYRLHVLGFFNLGISECPGNCGLKDQLLALKWVKENISQFGGDKTNITIFGESAGASSVHLHMISPLSKGFFNRAIIQSGTALASWSLIENPTEAAFSFGRSMGFEGNDPKKLSEFLKKQSAENLVKASEKFNILLIKENASKSSNLVFIPSVETIKEDAILPDHPKNLFKTAEPVPLIAGFNDKEGRLMFSLISSYTIKLLQGDFSTFIKQNIPCHSSKIKELSDKVQQFYFGDKPIGIESIDEFNDLYTDIYFHNFYESFEYITKSNAPVYVYLFSYNGKFNYFNKFFAKNATTGASHADDLMYLFHSKRSGMLITEIEDPEKTVINNICTMWTNFAKTGNPTEGMKNIEWKPSKLDNPYYLQIDKDLTLKKGKVLEERFAFWKNINEIVSKYPAE